MTHRHKFIPCTFKGYEYCSECGTYHSYMQVNPKDIYENDYWSYDHKRSKPEEQVENLQCTDDCGISKVDKILEFVPKGKTVLEIGCFPGVLLKKLTDLGFDTVGVEPDDKNIDFILKQSPTSAILHGYFPQVFKNINMQFDCIIGMDVFEHVNFYEDFINEAHRLLVPKGTLILMSPIILEDGLYRDRDFEHPDEHSWIFSKNFIQSYLREIFSKVVFGRWQNGHELIILTK